MSQGPPHPERTTLRSASPEKVSHVSPHAKAETTSSSSRMSPPTTNSRSPISSTFAERIRPSPLPGTSILTSGPVKTAHVSGSSSELETSSPPNSSSTSVDTLATSEVTTDPVKSHPSPNPAVTSRVETSSSAHESTSSDLAGSETASAMSPVGATSTMEDTVHSESISAFAEARTFQTEPSSSVTSGLKETSAFAEATFATETSAVLSEVPTSAMTGVSRTDVISSTRPSVSVPVQSSVSSPMSAETIGSLSASSVSIMSESAQMTVTSQTSSPVSPSRGTLNLGKSATTRSLAGSYSTLSQGFQHSEVTTLTSRGPERVSGTGPPPVEGATSSSSLMSVPATNSPSPVASTLLMNVPSSPLSVTSLLTPGLRETTDVLGTSSGETSSPPSWSRTSVDLPTTSGFTIDTEKSHRFSHVAVPNVGTSSSARESTSSGLAGSESASTTSPVGATSTMEDTVLSESISAFTEARKFQTEPNSSVTSGLKETSAFAEAILATETSAVLSKVPARATIEGSGTEAVASSRTTIPGPDRSTVSSSVSKETITPFSPVSRSAGMALATQTSSPVTLQGTHTLGMSATTSLAGSQSTVSQGPPHPEMTTLRSASPEKVSDVSPHTKAETTSSSSLLSLPATNSPSPVSSTFAERIPSSPLPVTSLLTPGLRVTSDVLITSSEAETSSRPSWSHTSINLLTTSGITTDTEKIHPFSNVAVTNAGTSSSAPESTSSVLADSETTTATSPVGATSTMEDAVHSTSLSASTEARTFQTETSSSVTSGSKETSAFEEASLATETSAVLSDMPTRAATEGSRTEVVASSRTTIPCLDRSTMSSSVSKETITPFSSGPKSAETTLTNQTSSPVTPQGTHTLGTSTAASLSGLRSTVSQGPPHPARTTLRSASPEKVSQTSLHTKAETTSYSSLMSPPATNSPSPISSTFAKRIRPSPLPGTSILTSGPVKTADVPGSSSELETSSPPNSSSTSVDTLATSEVTTDPVKSHPSPNPAVTSRVETSSSAHESTSSDLAGSETASATSPVGATSTMEDTVHFESISAFAEARTFQTEPSLSVTSGLKETSAFAEATFATETSAVLSEVPARATIEGSGTEAMASSRTTIPGPDRSTVLSSVSKETITPFSPVSKSAGMALAIQTSSPVTPQGTHTLGTSAATSWARPQSTVSQRPPHPERTTHMSASPGKVSHMSPHAEAETTSSSSLLSLSATNSPSPVPSTFAKHIHPSFLLGTSILTSGPVKTADVSGSSSEPETSSPPNSSSTSVDTLATSEATTDPLKSHPSPNPAVTSRVGTSSSAQESSSSVRAHTEGTTITLPMGNNSPAKAITLFSSTPLHETGGFQTTPASSLTSGWGKTSNPEETSSVTESSPFLPQVPTSATTGVSRTDVISSTRPSVSVPVQSSVSSPMSAETIGRLSASSVSIMSESAQMTVTSQTSSPVSPSRGTLSLGKSATIRSLAGSHSTLSQGFQHSEVTTLMSRGPERVSGTGPPPVEGATSSSSLMSVPATNSPSPVASTLLMNVPSSSLPVTSLLTPGLRETTDVLGTSSEGETNSPPSWSRTSVDLPTTSGFTIDTEKSHPFSHVAVTNAGTSSSARESTSPGLAASETASTTSPVGATSTMEDTIRPTSISASAEARTFQTETSWSVTSGLKETSAFVEATLATEKSVVLSKVPASATFAGSRTEAVAFSRTTIPGPDRSTVSSSISKEAITRLSASSISIMSESADTTVTSQTSSPVSPSRGTLSLGKSATTRSLAGSHSTLSQGFQHSEVTTLMSRGPERVSGTGPPPVEGVTSSSSLMSVPATNSPSPVASTLLMHAPSSPFPVTLILTPGLRETTDVLGTSSEADSSSPSNLSSTSVDILATSEVTRDTEKIHLSSIPAVTNVETSHSGQESHFSVIPDSETAKASFPVVTTSTLVGDTSVPMSTSAFFGTSGIQTQTTPSLTPGLRETSHYEGTSLDRETSTVLSEVLTGDSTEVSRSEVTLSSIPGSAQPTVTPVFSTETTTMLPTSPIATKSEEMTITTQTGLPGSTAQRTLALDISSTASWLGTHSSVTHGFSLSEMITHMGRDSEEMSWSSHPSVEETSSVSSLLSLSATNAPSSISSISPESVPSSPLPVTSFPTPGLMKTTDVLDTHSEPGTGSSPNLNSTSTEMLATSEVITDTEEIQLSSNTAVTSVGTSASKHVLPVSVPIHSESPIATYPMGTSSSMAETTISTSMPTYSETTGFKVEPLSHMTSGLRETSMSLGTSSATPTQTPSSPVSTHLLQSGKTDVTSSVKIPVSDQPPFLQYTEIPVKIITPFDASPSVIESTGVTAFPESKFSMSVSESTYRLSTGMLPSTETISDDTLMSSSSETMASFAITGVPAASLVSGSPFSKIESSSRDAALSTTAESLSLSTSTPFPSSTSTTTDSSIIPALPGITSSPASPHPVNTSLGFESSTTEGPLVNVSTSETWTQPVRTSLSSILDTRMTKSAELEKVTSANQVPPFSTQLPRTEHVMERITKIPNDAKHGSTIGPIKGPLAATSPSSPRGLHTRETEKAKTTTTSLKTTSTATLTTKVYTPTSETLTPLKIPVQMTNTITTRMMIRTPDVSPVMTSSLATRLGAEISTDVPRTTLPIFNGESETTVSLVPSSGSETSSAIQTLAVSPGEPDTTASWVIHPAETTPPISKTTLSVSHSKSDTTPSTATSPVEDIGSALPTSVVFSNIPEVVTSLVIGSETHISTILPTPTVLPRELETTASWITHPSETSPVVSRTVPDFSHSESDATLSVATSPGAQAHSVVSTTTILPSVPGLETSVVTSSGPDTSTAISSLTLSPGKPETTQSLVTHPGTQTSSAILTATISPGVLGVVTALVTSSGAETSTTIPTLTISSTVPTLSISPGEPDTTALWVTHPAETSPTVPRTMPNFLHSKSDTIPSVATSHGTEASSAAPKTVSSGTQGAVTSLVTSSMAVTSTTIPTLTISTDEPETTASLVTHSEAQTISAIPTLTVSPRVSEIVTSRVTGSVAETSMFPTLTVALGQPEATASWVTHPGTEASSVVPDLTASTDEPDTTVLMEPSPAETSPTATRTTSIFSHSKSYGTSSTDISPAADSSSAISTTHFSASVPDMLTSLVTSLGTDTSTSLSASNESPHESETTISWVTLSAETSQMVPRTTSNFSHSESHTTPLIATSPGAEVSSAVPTITISSDVKDMVTSRVTSSETEITTATQILTPPVGESEITASSVTHLGTHSSSATPSPAVSPGVSEMVTSQVMTSGTDLNITLPTLTLSTGEPETTVSFSTHPGTHLSSAIPTLAASPGVSERVTSQVTTSGTDLSITLPTLTVSPGEPKTTASSVTHLRTHSSSAIPSLAASLGVSERVTSQVTTSGTDLSITLPTLTVSPGEPKTTASSVTHLRTHSSSVIPSLAASRGISKMVTSQATTSGTDMGITLPTLTLSPGEQETIASSVTHPRTHSSSSLPTPAVSPGVSEMATSQVTTSVTDLSIILPILTLSTGELETTVSLSTHPGTHSSSAVPTLAVSPSESGLVTSQVTTSEEKTSTTIPTLTASSGQPDTTASWHTHSWTEASLVAPTIPVSPDESDTTAWWVNMMTSLATTSGSDTSTFPTLNESPHEPKTTASGVPHPEETSTIVSRTTPYFLHSKSDTSPSMATSSGTEVNSAVSTMSTSPGVSDMVTSKVTSSETDTNITLPIVTEPPYEPGKTASWLTPLAETSPTAPRTAPDFSYSKSDTTPSMATSPGTETNSTVPVKTTSPSIPGVVTPAVTSSRTDTNMNVSALTLFPGIPETTTSLVTHPGKQIGSTVPTLPVSSGEPDTTASWVTPPAETNTPASRTIPNLSHAKPDTTHLTTSSPGAEASSAVPTIMISPGVPDVMTSQVTSSGTATSTIIPTLAHSPIEPETTALLITHPSAETSTTFPTSTILPRVLETTASPSIRTGTQITIAPPAQTVSLGAQATISPLFTPPVTESSRVDLGQTGSPGVSAETASLSTHPETDTSTTITTSMLSPGFLESTSILATSSSTQAGIGLPTLPISPGGPGLASVSTTTGKPNTVTSWNAKTSSPITTVGLPEFFMEVTGTSMTLKPSETPIPPKTSHGEGVNPVTILTTTMVETTNLVATGSNPTVVKTTATLNTLTGSPFAPLTTPEMSTLAAESVTSRTAPSTAEVPVLIPFTVNFTITNLHYTKDMGHPGSEIFTATERTLQHLLEPLFQKSNVASLYSGCRLTSLRDENVGKGTRIDVICTYHPDPTGLKLDRERLYWELSQLTHGVTRLGSYILDRDSLYVNGYNHRYKISATSTAGVRPDLVPFTLNFTITNLFYTPDMGHPGSLTFNSTEKTLNYLLEALFKNTSIGPRYSGCRLTLLRTEKDGAATGVDAICTYHPGPMDPGLDREQLHQELSQLTHGVTQLGPYTLDRGSLHVDGYNRQDWIPTTSTAGVGPGLVPFTLNFTITNLLYTSDMEYPGSLTFNSTEKTLNDLLKPLFKNTSVGSSYSGCRLTLLRSKKNGTATGVDAICTYNPVPMDPGLDREQLYQELSHLTHGVTKLGLYTLDRDSLYVNGESPYCSYNQQDWTPTTSTPVTSTSSTSVSTTSTPRSTVVGVSPRLVSFTLNFTITNLHYAPDMGRPGSLTFNSTEKTLNRLLEPLFKNTSVGSSYSGCGLTLLRNEKNGAATRVDAICTYHHDPRDPGLEREQLYQELSHLTHGVTQLSLYTLDRDSLYVNGYNHRDWTPTTSAAFVGPGLVPFTLNFTITNLLYSPDMGHPGSLTFNSTEKTLSHLLEPLFKNTHVGSNYSGCRLTLLRNEKDRSATGVDAVCTYHTGSMDLELDREQLYQELSQLTHGVTWLGRYTLDRDSLYVNAPMMSTFSAGIFTSSTPSPAATEPSLVMFTLNFTITNLHYREDMKLPGSGIFNTTERTLTRLLKLLFQNSSIGPLYSGCRLAFLRTEKDGTATGVDAVCTHLPDPMGLELDRERLYWELSRLTHGVTRLGSYILDRDSLYVNDFTHRSSVPTTSTPRTSTVDLRSSGSPSSLLSLTTSPPFLVPFTLNFTITNLHYRESMRYPGSRRFNTTERVLRGLLRNLFKNTSVGPLYSGCRLALLRPEKDGAATRVNTICTYHSDPTGLRLDREQLYWELSRLTHGVTHLGSYTLDRDSLHVNGYTPLTLPAPGTITSTVAGEVSKELFTLNFTIVNLRYMTDMGRPGSHKFNLTDSVLGHLLSPLFQRSSLGARYTGCRVTTIRPEKNGAHTRVDFLCTYQQPPDGPGLPAKQVFHDLSWQTRGIAWLGPYSLDKDSLYVN
ncbi:mucin-16-like, partial [Carlito syrichta]|uniref:Mucin-16-like n=1 Tax=Carlito syrichta TaxID=1868482 RepID=A0A3Q0DPR1_CARSF